MQTCFVKTVARIHAENKSCTPNHRAKKKQHQKQAGELVCQGKSGGNKGALLWILRTNFALNLGQKCFLQVLVSILAFRAGVSQDSQASETHTA